MKRTLTTSMTLAMFICVALGGLSACSSEATTEAGVEPSLGVPVTMFRDDPVVTADLGVLGTTQTTVAPQPEEIAFEVVPESGRPSLIWYAIIGLVVGVVVTLAARRLASQRLDRSR